MPFPWTFPQERIWVETSYVFIRDKLIILKLSKKEREQIIDLCTDWSDVLVEDCWKWNHGQVHPLRFFVKLEYLDQHELTILHII